MAESSTSGSDTALRGDRLEAFLAELAAAPGAQAAAQCLTDTFAAETGVRRVLLYVLEEGEGALRLLAATPRRDDAQGVPARVVRDDAATQPLFAAALSLLPMAGDEAAEPSALGRGAWLAVPLPQPRLSWSSPPLPVEIAMERASTGWRPVMPSHGERRGRVGLAPLGVAALELADASDAREVVEALLPAATLAGPIVSRGLAVEQYRETAERLDRQHDLLAQLIDSLPDPVVLAPPGPWAETPVLVQNRRAARLLDASPPRDAVTEPIDEAAAEERRRVVAANNAALGAAVAQDATHDARELSLRDPENGAELRFELCDHALHGAPDRNGARLLVLRDVTALRGADAQLQRQVQRARSAEREATRERDRLNRILDYVADPIIVTDDAGHVVECNQQAQKLLLAGASAEGDDEESRVRRDANLQAFTAFVRALPDAGATSRARLTLVQPATGNPLPVEVVAGTVLDPEGEPPVVVSVLHDLTTHVENERLYEELKRFSAVLEARVRAATADLAEQNAQLQWQSEELERANRLKSEFLASVSHELRTPINALIGYTALLRDHVYGDLTPKQEDGLRRIHTSAEHLLALINDILDLARIEAGKIAVSLERVAIGPLLRDATMQTETLARGKGLEFRLEIPGEPLVVRTDPEKFRQVLGNLLSNALKFTANGSIVVRARREADRVRVDVADTGIGIRTEDLGAIWDDFRQLDQSRTREYGGTGLGLSIVRKLADRLDARVSVSSAPDEGSVFSVSLPAADDAPVPAEEAA
ncbi:PAS sensor protein [Gemmatirosa kalamazoonensis]|uniref:histidine kinase n=1 Tax=Gemmatirosa kalamazoonensis TaxID=861299 RepID=W0RLN4_9BACT|nr:ATP-binding protein [Gemmatirosa kalamazoonensis]AHG90343.1 PAS sensor protein [Gemmatirosa kalamazoonensis]